jgi:O-methyltransferase
MLEVGIGPRYLDLLKRVLTDSVYIERRGEDMQKRSVGLDWPQHADTMVGLARLNNVQFCVEDVIQRGIRGDLIETGVWRGGTCIFMRAVLKAHGVEDRNVWVCDSFEGLPPPNAAAYPADAGDQHHTFENLKISVEDVQDNFRRYDLLDEKVRFLKGWFKDTLPTAPIDRIAVLRLDGDMYESTMDALHALYDKVVPGGYVIVDDFALPPCRQAIVDFRQQRGIQDGVAQIDWTGVFWRKSGNDAVPAPAPAVAALATGQPQPEDEAAGIDRRKREAAVKALESARQALTAGDRETAARRLEQALRHVPDMPEVSALLEQLRKG